MEQRGAHRRLLGIPGSGKEFFYIYIKTIIWAAVRDSWLKFTSS